MSAHDETGTRPQGTVDPDVPKWLAARALPLATVEPGGDDADLAPLRDVLAGVQVVGLGEATHGSREFFTLKHRLVAYLVAGLGVRVLAFEASESAAVAVDTFVGGGPGDGGAALAGLGFWTWNTREVLTMLEWLRARNAQVPPQQRVRFVGIDAQRPAAAVDAVSAWLVAAGVATPVFTQALAALRSSRVQSAALPRSVADTVAEIARLVAGRADPHGPPAGRLARRQAPHLVRAAALATAPREPVTSTEAVYAVRDQLMAQAVSAQLDEVAATAAPDGGPAVALWAHNGHIGCQSGPGRVTSLGEHLRRRWGRAYYALALLAGSGSFRARRARPLLGLTATPVEHRLAPPPPQVLESLLAGAHPSDHLVDLRDDDPPPAVARWLTAPSWTRSHGAVTSVLHRMAFTPTVPAEYDGLAFVHRTRPTVPR